MSNAPIENVGPVTGFNANIIADGGVSAETAILKSWSQATSDEAAAEANFALKAQQYATALTTNQTNFAADIVKQMQDKDNINQSTGTNEQALQARLQAYQSVVSSLTQISSSARDDANNKQQNLASNDLITTAMDPNNKVAALVTSLAPAIG